MNQYHDYLRHILNNGSHKSDRTGTGTISTFGYQMRFDLSAGFPIMTTKKIHLKSIIHELLWFLSGDTNVKYLQDNGVTIWNEWADENGDLGPVYGKMWREWPNARIERKTVILDGIEQEIQMVVEDRPIDQITAVVEELKRNPDSRRLIVSGWNPSLLPDPAISPMENATLGRQALPPCHTMWQLYVQDGKLSCQLYARSQDAFLGTPYNITSYSLLTMMIAQVVGLGVGEYIHTVGDAHIYVNHLDQVREQLSREAYPLPKMILNPEVRDLLSFQYGDFTLEGYQSHPAIKAPIAI